MNKIIFFDCDGTLWRTDDDDYISSNPSTYNFIQKNILERDVDKKKFWLRGGVHSALIKLQKQGYKLGIVSDNLYEPTVAALDYFNILQYFEQKYMYISLREGRCPKSNIIKDLIKNNIDQVVLFDDIDYSQDMGEHGYQFYLCHKDSSLDMDVGSFLQQ